MNPVFRVRRSTNGNEYSQESYSVCSHCSSIAIDTKRTQRAASRVSIFLRVGPLTRAPRVTHHHHSFSCIPTARALLNRVHVFISFIFPVSLVVIFCVADWIVFSFNNNIYTYNISILNKKTKHMRWSYRLTKHALKTIDRYTLYYTVSFWKY